MTLANCKLYLAEAKDEKTKKFWDERIARKYPEDKPVVVEKPVEKPVKKKKEVKA